MMMVMACRCEDAFPLDDTESVDTDSDGIGNNRIRMMTVMV